jgi:hypothetical protein
MAAGPTRQLTSEDAKKTYRYLRIGIIGTVVLLAVSIAIERSKVSCYQTSISAYYYTPARAIFVSSMIVVGLALIVYKGRGVWEDTCLNFAGMFAPVVAVAPTTDAGTCWSVEPIPRPIKPDGSLAAWVVDNINNNFHALLIAGGIGLVVSLILVIVVEFRHSKNPVKSLKAPVAKVERGTWASLTATAVLLLLGWWLIENWSDFYTRAHGFSAVIFFFFLGLAIVFNAVVHWRKERSLFWVYMGVAILMLLGFILIPALRVGGDHTVFWLEAWEIFMFLIYWIVQTAENWGEEVVGTDRE